MKIVDATPEEKRLVRGVVTRINTNASPEVKAVLGLGRNKALRIVDHDHAVYAYHTMCVLALRLQAAAQRHGVKISLRHSGSDLLVGRLK